MKIKAFYIAISLLLFQHIGFGQSSYSSRLSLPDTSNAYALLNYSRIIQKESPTKAFDFIEKALKISIDKKDEKAEGT